MSGLLYIVATPIGNLSDITFRAVETLKNVDLVLAEDTRHSKKLFDHYEIKSPLKHFMSTMKMRRSMALLVRLILESQSHLLAMQGHHL